MEKIPKSGLYYPNNFLRIMLYALEDVMGKNGVNAILNLAGLKDLIDNYPANNLDRQFDFSDVSAITMALIELYGLRGGRGLALRAGRATFDDGLRSFGALAGVGDLAFKVLPLNTKIHIGLPALARIFSQVSDQKSTVEDKGSTLVYTIHKCPVCWGREVDQPICFIASGLIQSGLKWLSGGSEFRVAQSTCKACGDENCQFVINKEPISAPK